MTTTPPAATDSAVLVTGAAGFVGSHLVRALGRADRPVVAADLAADLPDRALRGLDHHRVSYVSGDLRQDETLDAVIKTAGGAMDVVHVAAVTRYAQLGRLLGESAATPSAALVSFDINAVASWRLCLRLAGDDLLGRFVQVSTRAVFGNEPRAVDSIDENSELRPVGIYGASKAAAEIGALALRDEFGLDLVVARITGVFGPWQGPVSWIGQAVAAVVAGRSYQAGVGGDDAYELTYVKDVVRGLVLLLHAPRLNHAAYHLASGRPLVTLAQVAAALRAADPNADVDFGSGHNRAAAGRTPLGIARAATDFGFAARWELPAAVADYLRIERTGRYGTEALDDPGSDGRSCDAPDSVSHGKRRRGDRRRRR